MTLAGLCRCFWEVVEIGVERDAGERDGSCAGGLLPSGGLGHMTTYMSITWHHMSLTRPPHESHMTLHEPHKATTWVSHDITWHHMSLTWASQGHHISLTWHYMHVTWCMWHHMTSAVFMDNYRRKNTTLTMLFWARNSVNSREAIR